VVRWSALNETSQSKRRGRAIGSPRGRIYFSEQRVLYLGPSLAVSAHRHYAVQVFLPLSGRIRLRTGPGAKWREFQGAVVPSGLRHEADSPVSLLATLWLDPNLEKAQRLAPPRAHAAIASVDRARLERIAPRLRECWNEGCASQRAFALVDEVAESLAPPPTPEPALDPRVALARRMLRSLARSRASVGEIAAALSLSPSRLTHLFSAELGMPPRRYLLWLRLLDAVDALAHRASIAEAACDAGFSDAPHLTRTFRRMLGFTPAAAQHVDFLRAASPERGSRIVQDAPSSPG
jgi:AraC-like DNA-binding protein